MEGEQLNFFEMLEVEDKKEKHLKAQNKPIEKQKEKTSNLSDSAKNTTQAKKKTKVKSKPKEVKILTLEEQIEEVEKGKNKSLNLILKYLLTLDGMKEKMSNKDKSLKECWNFIKSSAQQKAIDGCAAIEDKEVYGWAVHYYEEAKPEPIK